MTDKKIKNENLRDVIFNAVSEIEIDLEVNFSKAHCLFREVQDDLFSTIEPNTKQYEENYNSLQTKIDIVGDYLFKVFDNMNDLEDKLSAAIGIEK